MDEESIVLQTPKSPPHHRHWLWPPIETIVGRSLHSLPTGLIKTPWIGVRAFVLYLSLGLARRFGAIAEVSTKAMPYVRPELHKLQWTTLYSNPNRWEGFTKPGAESSNSIVTQRVLIRNLISETWVGRIRPTQTRFKFPTVWFRWVLNSSSVKSSETFNKLLRCLMTSKQPSHACQKSSVSNQTHVEWVPSNSQFSNFSWNSMFGPYICRKCLRACPGNYKCSPGTGT